MFIGKNDHFTARLGRKHEREAATPLHTSPTAIAYQAARYTVVHGPCREALTCWLIAFCRCGVRGGSLAETMICKTDEELAKVLPGFHCPPTTDLEAVQAAWDAYVPTVKFGPRQAGALLCRPDEGALWFLCRHKRDKTSTVIAPLGPKLSAFARSVECEPCVPILPGEFRSRYSTIHKLTGGRLNIFRRVSTMGEHGVDDSVVQQLSLHSAATRVADYFATAEQSGFLPLDEQLAALPPPVRVGSRVSQALAHRLVGLTDDELFACMRAHLEFCTGDVARAIAELEAASEEEETSEDELEAVSETTSETGSETKTAVPIHEAGVWRADVCQHEMANEDEWLVWLNEHNGICPCPARHELHYFWNMLRDQAEADDDVDDEADDEADDDEAPLVDFPIPSNPFDEMPVVFPIPSMPSDETRVPSDEAPVDFPTPRVIPLPSRKRSRDDDDETDQAPKRKRTGDVNVPREVLLRLSDMMLEMHTMLREVARVEQ